MSRLLAFLVAAVLVAAVFVVSHRSAAGPSGPSPAAVTVGSVEVDDSARYRPQVGRRTSRPHHPTCTAANWRHRLKPAERFIYSHESGLNPAAREPTTGAYGLGQLLASTYRNLGLPMTSDPCDQRRAATAYMRERYGNWRNALTHWQEVSWW